MPSQILAGGVLPWPVSAERLQQAREFLDRYKSIDLPPLYFAHLRRKIEKKPDSPEHILTVYGYGYKLVS